MGKAALQWTDEMLAQLGKEKDAVLAERWGTTAKTVNLKRNALGIAPYGQLKWDEAALALLGQLPDAEVARRLYPGRDIDVLPIHAEEPAAD